MSLEISNTYYRQAPNFASSLPTDLIKIIVSFLSNAETYPLRFVCKRFSQLGALKTYKMTACTAYEPGIKISSIAYFKWLKGQKFPLSMALFNLVALEGKLDLAKWMKQNGGYWNAYTCAYAAAKGHFNMLKWLFENGCPWNEWTFHNAAEIGSLILLKWLMERNCPWDEWTSASAAGGGNLEALQFLSANGCPSDHKACMSAASNEHTEVLKWLETSPNFNEELCILARKWYHDKMHKWRAENKYSLQERVPKIKSKEAQIEFLEWLIANGLPLTAGATIEAVELGCLEILKWLREKGCPFHKKCCIAASKRGHLDILKWLVEKGCPLDKDECFNVSEDDDIRKWIVEKNI